MPSIKLRCVKKNDFEELAMLLTEGFQSDPYDVWMYRFHTWWIENPSMDPSIPWGWVLEKDEEEIVGFLGNIPVKYQINGFDEIAVAGSSFYVKPSVRGVMSIQLIQASLDQPNVKLLLHTTPNEISSKLYMRFGFEECNVPFTDTEFWYIRDYDKIFDFFIRKNVRSRYQPLLAIPHTFIKLISPLLLQLKDKRGSRIKKQKFVCSLCSKCDDSFAELWHNNQKEGMATLCRDVETLQWLFFSKAFVNKRYVIKCTDTQCNKLVGYFVLDIKNTFDKDIKVLHLKDVYVPQFDEDIILSFISFAKILAKDCNATAVTFWPTNEEMETILKKNFEIRRKNKLTYLYKFVNIGQNKKENDGISEFIPSYIDPNRGTM